MKRGLVVGKFMPLHRGHQLLIENALARCDDVTVVVYDTHVPGNYPPMPAKLRARWIRNLYPSLENVIHLDDPLMDEDKDVRDDPANASVYADQLRFLGVFNEVITSEPTYQEFATLLGAEHVVVDAARELVPISGTQIRENLYDHRGFIDPYVYGSLIQKVVFVGTESTGKSTLARAMAHEFGTWWVHEFGRELWVAQGGGSLRDHIKMGQRQYAREQAALINCRDYLFCDTNAWTTLMWSYMAYGTADPWLEDQVDSQLHEYIWILCDNDFPWVDDGVRELHGSLARDFHLELRDDLSSRLSSNGLDYHDVEGPLESRVEQVKEILIRERNRHR